MSGNENLNSVTAIDTSAFPDFGVQMSIELPQALIEMFTDMNDGKGVRLISFAYDGNISGLFPERYISCHCIYIFYISSLSLSVILLQDLYQLHFSVEMISVQLVTLLWMYL